MDNRMESAHHEIALGTPICEKLYEIYFYESKWPDCYRDVARKYSDLKSIAKKFYVGKDRYWIAKELIGYTNQDIIEAFKMEC